MGLVDDNVFQVAADKPENGGVERLFFFSSSAVRELDGLDDVVAGV